MKIWRHRSRFVSIDQYQFLIALADAGRFDIAANACGVTADELRSAIRSIESDFRRDIVAPGVDFSGLTSEGEQVVAWARTLVAEVRELQVDLQRLEDEAAVAPLLSRRSVSPKRLEAPGPDQAELDLILQAALRAPDNGNLLPWRVIEFREEQRAALGDLFEQEKLRRDPLASANDVRRAREHATRPPVLLAFVVSPRSRSKVPLREQWLAAGAAMCNLLNAAHQLRFGAIMLSGERCFDDVLAKKLGLGADEFLAGFISIGSIAQVPPRKKHAMPAEVWSCWWPEEADVPSSPSTGPADGSLSGSHRV
jgi:nitroreductase